MSISSFLTNSTNSTSSTNFTKQSFEFNKKQKSQSLLPKYAIRNITKTEIPTFHDLLIKMTISNGWAFQWVNNPSTQAFFHWLNPNLKLPDKKQLAGPILDQAIQNVDKVRQDKLNQIHEQAGITLAFDGWKNIINQEILGIMMIMPSGETLVWKAIDISDQRERAIDIILHIENLLEELKEKSIKIAAIVSDSAAAYASAQ